MHNLIEAPRPQLASERIATVDVCHLPLFRWPFLGVRDPDFVVEVQIALGRYLRELQASGDWRDLRVVPHSADDLLPDHVFDVFGTPVRERLVA